MLFFPYAAIRIYGFQQVVIGIVGAADLRNGCLRNRSFCQQGFPQDISPSVPYKGLFPSQRIPHPDQAVQVIVAVGISHAAGTASALPSAVFPDQVSEVVPFFPFYISFRVFDAADVMQSIVAVLRNPLYGFGADPSADLIIGMAEFIPLWADADAWHKLRILRILQCGEIILRTVSFGILFPLQASVSAVAVTQGFVVRMLSITEDRFFCKISVFIIAVARTASGIVPFLCAVSIPVIGIVYDKSIRELFFYLMSVLREGSAGHGIPAVLLINTVLPFIVAIFLGGAVLIFDLCHQFPAVMVGLFGSSGLWIKECRAVRNVIIGDAAARFVRIVLARYTAPAVKDVFGIALVILIGDGRNITFFIIGISCDAPAVLVDRDQMIPVIGICHIAADGICQAHESAIFYLYLNDAAS